jgi:hypothetical protein
MCRKQRTARNKFRSIEGFESQYILKELKKESPNLFEICINKNTSQFYSELGNMRFYIFLCKNAFLAIYSILIKTKKKLDWNI